MDNQRWDDLKSEVLEKTPIEEFARAHLEGVVSGGPGELKALCLFHDETKPSLHVNLEGRGFFCQGCGEKGNLIDLFMKVKDLHFKEALLQMAADLGLDTKNPSGASAPRRAPRTPPSNPPISMNKVKAWHADLRSQPARAKWLIMHRGMLRKTLAKYLIGWDGHRYTIPVFDGEGKVVNVRRYHPDKGSAKIIHYTERRGDKTLKYGRPARLFGLDELQRAKNGARVHIAEGEWDRLLLAQQGWVAVTGTHGCKTWLKEWNVHFEGKDVVVLQDTDRQGKLAAARIAKEVGPVARSVRVVELPLEGEGQKDITDWFVAAGRGAEALEAVIDGTPPTAAPDDTGEGDLDFKVIKIVTFDSVPKKYVLTIEPSGRPGGEMEINYATLSKMGRFEDAFGNYFNRVPEGMPTSSRAWKKIVNVWLDRSITVDMPPEASELGALREVLTEELRKMPVSEGRSELDRAKALMTPKGERIFRAICLRRVMQADFGDVSKHTFCAALNRLGCVNKVVKVEGHSVKVWTIPKELWEEEKDGQRTLM